ncbi:MAG: hypothetical protein WBD31_25170 [Rubripirellula sp.]
MKRTISKIAAVAFLAFAGVQVHAFVNTQETAAVAQDSSSLMDQIEAIANQIADKSLTSDEALSKINKVIDQIDALLDSEPANEGDLLDLRDALVDMRLELSEEEGTQTEVAMGDGTIIDGGGILPMDGGIIGDGGWVSSGGGGGGGVAAGGGGGGLLSRPLLLGGAAAAIALGVSCGDDDDDPVASLGTP